MNFSGKLRDAREAMLLARVDLDDYHNNREPVPEVFDELYRAVRITTAEYVRLLKEEIKTNYGSFKKRIAKEPSPLSE